MESNFLDDYNKCIVTERGGQLLLDTERNKRKKNSKSAYGLLRKILLWPVALYCRFLLFMCYILYIINKIAALVVPGGKTKRVKETHSMTSIIVAAQRYQSYQIGICDDYLAGCFLSPWMALWYKLQGLLTWVCQLQYGPLFGLDQIGYLACRTQFLDSVVVNSRPEQLVILGAGMDTRSYRLSLPSTCVCFEVDTLHTQGFKRSIGIPRIHTQLHSNKNDNGKNNNNKIMRKEVNSRTVKYVEIDFEEQDFFAELIRNGFDPAKKTTFVLEGVSYYLTQAAMLDTLSKVRRCTHKDTIIAFDFATDYWTTAPRGSSLSHAVYYLKCIGEPFLYGIPPKSSPEREFGPLGFHVDVWLGPWAFQNRYLGSRGLSEYHNLVMNLGVMSLKQ